MVEKQKLVFLSRKAHKCLDEYLAWKKGETSSDFDFPPGQEFMYVLGHGPKDRPPMRTHPELVRRFVSRVADTLNYEIKFTPYAPGKSALDLKDYVSWLVVTQRATRKTRGVLHVIYNTDRLDEELNPGDYRLFKEKLAKVFLHECAHALVHLKRLRVVAGTETLPHQENEGWVLALCLWALLIGSAAEWWRRSPEQADHAWILA